MTDTDFGFRPVDPRADAALLHSWITHPKAAFWMMQDARQADIERVYTETAADEHQEALLGLRGERPVFPHGDVRPGAPGTGRPLRGAPR